MSEAKDTIAAPKHKILLALLESDARQLHSYLTNPPPNGLSPESVRSHLANMYSNAESLVELAEEARAKAQADAEKNGNAPAEQVN